MLNELLRIFRSDDPLAEMSGSFSDMLALAREVTLEAGAIYFGGEADPEQRTRLLKQDVQINKLERRIRKHVIAHLSMPGNAPSAPYCLLLMSLVKDVERIGDYAKNLAEVIDFRAHVPADDELTAELSEIRAGVEEMLDVAAGVFEASDRDRAVELIQGGKNLARRCDALVERIARSDYGARDAAAAVLGSRYYKRIASHLLNLLTGVVMPLHKLDYYDEKDVEPAEEE